MTLLKKALNSAIALLLIASASALAADSDILLKNLFAVGSFSADFQQTVKDPAGKLLLSSEGHMSMLRPNHFRMDVVSPDESQIIADGEAVYSYDAMLEQVTIYNFSTQVADSPLMLLITKDPKVWDNYQVVQVSADNFKITPKNTMGMVKSMDVHLKNNILDKLVITEMDDKNNTYEFKSVSIKELPVDSFKFIIPKGVEVDDQRSK